MAKTPVKKQAKASIEDLALRAQERFQIIGRKQELLTLATAMTAKRHVLIEGPVGVGKTLLAQSLAQLLGKTVFRVDGDSRFTEQKLSGWFDPSLALKKGFNGKSFIPGPLVEAMKTGGILFINELNRMPEAVQNVLLPAMDEGLVNIPQLGEIRAKEGFLIVATQNPKEFVATSHLSEALMDRMEWVYLSHQNFTEEKQIAEKASGFNEEPYASTIVHIVRMTRSHPKIKRGASVRAAIAIGKILKSLSETTKVTEESFLRALSLALPTRIELIHQESEGPTTQVFQNLVMELYAEVKKNFSPGMKTEVYHTVQGNS